VSPDEAPWSAIVRNEFAMVELSLEPCVSGYVLRITDLVGCASVTLDATQLEALCWLERDRRTELVRRYEDE
jgi:hypothetical protein